MIIEPLRVDHYHRLAAQPAQARVGEFVSAEQVAALAEGDAFAAIADGVVIGIGGLVRQWNGRAVLWSVLAATAGRQFVAVHRAVCRFIALAPDRRLEVSVRCDHVEGHRWAQMLGFHLEAACMRAYGPDGCDYALYARTRP